jgi:uncharacterized membrane protein
MTALETRAADARSARGLERLVNFSDATVAIAITLLILPLVDVANDIATHPVAEVLESHLGTLTGFVITFAVIGRFWLIHHHVFEVADGYSYALVRVNLFWLACIVFLPFAANLLSNAPDDEPLVYGIYIGTMVVTNASMGVMEWMIRLGASPADRPQLDLVQSVATTALLLVALVLAVTVPAINMYALLVLIIAAPLSAIRKASARKSVRVTRK